jgi:hypothetical protein
MRLGRTDRKFLSWLADRLTPYRKNRLGQFTADVFKA